MIRSPRPPLRHFALVLWLLLAATPAAAQSPADLVTWLYASLATPGPAPKGLAYIAQPDQRAQFFTSRMVTFYEANESYGDDLMAACVDFGFDVPGNDFDAAEIARTLQITTTGDTAAQTVTATFTTFGQPAQVAYDFLPMDGTWRIDDIAGPGFRVSQIPCTPKATTASDGGTRGTGYCYNTGDSTLILDVYGDGRAGFEVESWQNGHACAASGVARAGDGGWVFESGTSAPSCRLTIAVTPDGGIRLTDPGYGCQIYCGASAAMDGLTFTRAAQVGCAEMPRH